MECSPYYESDVLAYFDGHAEERALYEAFFRRLCAQFPACSVKVQKSQISFYNRHLFAAASLPVRRKKDWPKTCILVTFGLSHRLDSPVWPWRWSPIPTAGPTMWWSPRPSSWTTPSSPGSRRPISSPKPNR